MGCDIHQANIMVSAATKQPWAIEGETGPSTETPYEHVPQFIDGRCYDLFGILAGVRSEMFQIEQDVHTGIPEEIPEDMKKWLADRDYCWHSFTWYYLSDLLKQLRWTRKKIKMWMKDMRASDPDFISDGCIDDFIWLIEAVSSWVKDLEKAKAKLTSEGREEDFNCSKVFFFFDC